MDEGDRKRNKDRGGKGDKGKGGGGKYNNEGKENVRTAEDFLALCVACKTRGHRKRQTAAGTNPPESGKDTASLEATSSTASQLDALMTEVLLPLHYDGCKAGSDTSTGCSPWRISRRAKTSS